MSATQPWDVIAELIPHVLWVTDADGSAEYFNRRGLDLVGLSPQEMSGWGWLRALHPDDGSRAREVWEGAIRDGSAYQVEYRVRTSAGDFRWMVARAVPLPGADGRVIGWAGTWTDVDDLKSLQDHLGGARTRPAASLAVLEAIHATVRLAIGSVDREFRIVHMNELSAGLNGFSVEDVEGRLLAEVSSMWPQVEPFFRQVLETGEAIVNVGVDRPTVDGRPGQWLSSYFPVGLATEVIGVVVVSVDITEHRLDEEFRSVVTDHVAEGLQISQLIGDLLQDLDGRFDVILEHLNAVNATATVEAARQVQVGATFDVAAGPATGDLLSDDVVMVRPRITHRSQGLGSDLTVREQEVLRLMSSALTNRDIAGHLNLSVNTVRGHVQKLLAKLGAHSKLEAVLIAAQHGLVDRQA